MKNYFKKHIIIFTIIAMLLPIPAYGETIVKNQAFFDAVREYILNNYALEVTEEQLFDAAIRGMFDALDPYSRYLTIEETQSFVEDSRGSFAGIGASIGKREDGFFIIETFPNSPARRAGLLPMDRIIKVDGEAVSMSMDLSYLVEKIKGPRGTDVNLVIQRKEEIKEIRITRDIIRVSPVESEVLEDGIGYLRIREFNSNVTRDVSIEIARLQIAGVKRVVLDLRGNPGGLLNEVVTVSNFFTPRGRILEVRYKNKPSEVYTSNGNQKFEKVAVLIDGSTASAGEILAGVIRDTNSGVLIGEKTFGKGTVQDLFTLRNGEAIKLTVARYILPSGKDINNIGIFPDINIPSSENQKQGKDVQLEKAIETLRNR